MAAEPKTKPSPQMIALFNYKASEDFSKGSDPFTLWMGSDARIYLANRLEAAFIAGLAAGESIGRAAK